MCFKTILCLPLHLKVSGLIEDETCSIDFYNLRTLSHLTQYLIFVEVFQDVVSKLLKITLHRQELQHFFFLDNHPLRKCSNQIQFKQYR